eukprot:1729353-Alexandrium_andersonii.AAC.1
MAVPVGDQRRRAEVLARREEGRQAAGGQAKPAEVAWKERGRQDHHGDGSHEQGQDRRAVA